MLQAPDAVSRFLWSIGRPAEADFYLRLFRAEEKERFALIAVDSPVMTHALDALVVDLRFLSEMGLTPLVVLGLLDGGGAQREAAALAQELTRATVPAHLFAPVQLGSDTIAASARVAARLGAIPILPLDPTSHRTIASRFDTVHGLLRDLQTRKLIFLQRRGGIALEGQRVGIIEVSSDLPNVIASPDVSKKQKTLVKEIARELERIPHSCTFAITSPLDLLRELFTAAGAGTLVRRAARIEAHRDYASIDTKRLTTLLESAFNRPLSAGFLDRAVSRIYLETQYRGVAMVVETGLGAYMSKFAVERQAQGEGIGRDVWNALVADYATVFWRSRITNPVNAWYTKTCDGMARNDVWQVFWRGVPAERIPEAIAFALEQPKDFPKLPAPSKSS